MKKLTKALFAAAILGASASAQAWYWGAPVYGPAYGPAHAPGVAMTEEQHKALSAQQQAIAEQQRAAFEQQAAAHRKVVDAQRAVWEDRVRMDREVFPVNPWVDHVTVMQEMMQTEREMLEKMQARRQESRERFEAAREESRKRRAERL